MGGEKEQRNKKLHKNKPQGATSVVLLVTCVADDDDVDERTTFVQVHSFFIQVSFFLTLVFFCSSGCLNIKYCLVFPIKVV